MPTQEKHKSEGSREREREREFKAEYRALLIKCHPDKVNFWQKKDTKESANRITQKVNEINQEIEEKIKGGNFIDFDEKIKQLDKLKNKFAVLERYENGDLDKNSPDVKAALDLSDSEAVKKSSSKSEEGAETMGQEAKLRKEFHVDEDGMFLSEEGRGIKVGRISSFTGEVGILRFNADGQRIIDNMTGDYEYYSFSEVRRFLEEHGYKFKTREQLVNEKRKKAIEESYKKTLVYVTKEIDGWLSKGLDYFLWKSRELSTQKFANGSMQLSDLEEILESADENKFLEKKSGHKKIVEEFLDDNKVSSNDNDELKKYKEDLFKKLKLEIDSLLSKKKEEEKFRETLKEVRENMNKAISNFKKESSTIMFKFRRNLGI